ncbi:hypothetical protein Anas_13072 [Armadillidium nasatum]|uniref:Uncharacterized protein n=1 Tax=Armadillidium nasatum TaxID=96803 RepID=A0A5N5TF36_9CRUS|nr:hypothetical protein Anas_13072 [Armadillidium nasatum]
MIAMKKVCQPLGTQLRNCCIWNLVYTSKEAAKQLLVIHGFGLHPHHFFACLLSFSIEEILQTKIFAMNKKSSTINTKSIITLREMSMSEFGIAAKELSNIASSSHFTICIESVENLMLISSDGYFWIIHIYLMLLESCW